MEYGYCSLVATCEMSGRLYYAVRDEIFVFEAKSMLDLVTKEVRAPPLKCGDNVIFLQVY